VKPPAHILPIIVLAQFCCTSLWFASNAILDDLTAVFSLHQDAIAHLTSAVQLGFILGTLLFAFLALADRFASSKVFFICALLGGLGNLGMLFEGNTMSSLMVIRGATGFFLAGIYPVGMKIAADYYKEGLGKSLGYLVGALVMGTALPYLLKAISFDSSWELVVMITSGLAIFGGTILLLGVPNGPYRLKMQIWQGGLFLKVFQNRNFRKAAFGYFGHMWELYAFWAFLPLFLLGYSQVHPETSLNTTIWSFIIIASGGMGCIMAGYISKKIGVTKTAITALSGSAILCLLSPILFYAPLPIFLGCLIAWGILVTADSPMFSTLVASHVAPQMKATALTLVNSIGFAITIASMQLLSFLSAEINPMYLFVVLAIGPIIGVLVNFRRKQG